ncbi:MAG TPA: vWA domain-containing protein, partial [Candidatus Eisenbacteria bacterium]
MPLSTLHLAPNAPWPLLALATVALAVLGVWAYRFAIPPLPRLARRLLPALRIVAFLLLAWLLAQPVLERTGAGGVHVVALVDRSASMDLPAGPGLGTRAREADRVVADLTRAWRGRAEVDVVPFGARLGAAAGDVGRQGTALGDALLQLSSSAAGQRANGVVIVSDGAVNAGEDPVAAARSLGLPVHAVVVGSAGGQDRAVTEVESAANAEVGHTTTVRFRITTTEERGTPLTVRLLEGAEERDRAVVVAPGGGAEAAGEMHVTPSRPGLAVWAVRVDSLAGEISTANDAREVAVEVAPGRIGVTLVSAGLNWDLGFVRRALAGDSSLALTTWVREQGPGGGSGWRSIERPLAGGAPDAASLRGQTVVVLDGIAPPEVGSGFDAALAALVRGGGGLLLMGGGSPGLGRYRSGALGPDLALAPARGASAFSAPSGLGTSPEPTPEAREMLAWDDDPARGDRAWRAAAPLNDVLPIGAGAGDRVLISTPAAGTPLWLLRRIGRGQALLVNGTGVWRWSLSPFDDLSAERGRRLWRRAIHWIAEPVQGEPLRVRPERWLSAGGEPVRLFATLQDAGFHPVAGARVEGEIQDPAGGTRRIVFEPRTAGSYEAVLESPAPGRYKVSVRATGASGTAGAELGRAATEFAVDRWSLELARTQPDSATLAEVALVT